MLTNHLLYVYLYCELGSTLAAPPGNSAPSTPHTALSLTAQHGNVGVFQAALGQKKGGLQSGSKGFLWLTTAKKNYGLATVLGSRTLSHYPPSPGCLSQKVAVGMHVVPLLEGYEQLDTDRDQLCNHKASLYIYTV